MEWWMENLSCLTTEIARLSTKKYNLIRKTDNYRLQS